MSNKNLTARGFACDMFYKKLMGPLDSCRAHARACAEEDREKRASLSRLVPVRVVSVQDSASRVRNVFEEFDKLFVREKTHS